MAKLTVKAMGLNILPSIPCKVIMGINTKMIIRIPKAADLYISPAVLDTTLSNTF